MSSLLRHKAAGQLDEGSRRGHFLHLGSQLRPLRRHYVLGHGSAVGPGLVPEEEEAQHQAVCGRAAGQCSASSGEKSLTRFSRCRSVLQVFFLPLSNTILSCFSDDSIFAWESDTLFCKYQLPVPDSGPRISYKAFAVTL